MNSHATTRNTAAMGAAKTNQSVNVNSGAFLNVSAKIRLNERFGPVPEKLADHNLT
jgi:hypothetical protein